MGCPACGHPEMAAFFEVESAPVFCNVLYPDRSAALSAPRAKIALAYCSACGMIANTAFDPRLVAYSPDYENSLHFSPHFQTYAEELARGLIDRHQLFEKDVLEIGCGQGNFLALLAGIGRNRALGFDPSYDPSRSSVAAEAGVAVIPEYFDESHADRPADLICCRHVLEHIAQPVEFLEGLRRVLGDRRDTVLFFEVPNGLFTLRDMGVWDIIYEHCSYFTPISLWRTFRQAGLQPIDVTERYGGQFITLEARCRNGAPPSPPTPGISDADVADMVGRFGDAYRTRVEAWQTGLAQIRHEGLKVVLWGAGSKGVTFLNALGIDCTTVERVVDLNPSKHLRFVPGTGQQVVAPEHLQADPPDRVVVMNPVYRSEIEAMLEKMGLRPDVVPA